MPVSLKPDANTKKMRRIQYKKTYNYELLKATKNNTKIADFLVEPKDPKKPIVIPKPTKTLSSSISGIRAPSKITKVPKLLSRSQKPTKLNSTQGLYQKYEVIKSISTLVDSDEDGLKSKTLNKKSTTFKFVIK